MRSLIILLLLSFSIFANAQNSTTALNWKSAKGVEYVYNGQIKNGKPEGIGVGAGTDKKSRLFGEFKNGVVEGTAVSIQNDGAIILGNNWKNGFPNGMMVMLSPSKKLYYGNLGPNRFNGVTYEVDLDNNMKFCELRNSFYTGRAIIAYGNVDYLMDNYLEAGIKTGQGYQYDFDKDQFFQGIWKNDKAWKESAGNYPSFMRNGVHGQNSEQFKFIYASMDGNQNIQDTAFTWYRQSDWHCFGRFEKGTLVNGMAVKGDSAKIIGSFNKYQEKDGPCVDYRPGKYLNFGVYKDGELEGKAIHVELDIPATLYIGDYKHGIIQGSGAALVPNNEIRVGKYASGVMTKDIAILSSAESFAADTRSRKIEEAMHPKDVCAAMNYLFSAFYEDGFDFIKSYDKFNPEGSTAIDPFVSENPTTDYKSYFNFPGAKVNKVYEAYKQLGCYFGISVSDNYALVKKKYDDLCRQIKSCSITSLQKDKSMQVSGTATVPNKDGSAISTFYIAPFGGKTKTPKVVIILEKAGKWQLTGRVISYQDIE